MTFQTAKNTPWTEKNGNSLTEKVAAKACVAISGPSLPRQLKKVLAWDDGNDTTSNKIQIDHFGNKKNKDKEETFNLIYVLLLLSHYNFSLNPYYDEKT